MIRSNLADHKLDPHLQSVLNEVRDRLSAQFDIDRIVLFGSVVWGTPDAESDVDLLIVLNTQANLDTEDRISHIIFEINLENGTNLSELIVDRQSWDHGIASVMPIHDEIQQSGIRL